jgi:broad specificity phosphatase PhoE
VGEPVRLVFVRHAESTANVARSLDCAVPGPGLSPRGREQAAALAEGLSADPFGDPFTDLAGSRLRAVFTSPMTRARDTAEPLASRLGLRPRVLAGLREAYLGDLNDRTDTEAHEAFDRVFRAWLLDGDLDVRRPGGESGAEVLKRFADAFDELVAAHPGDTAVVVGHGAAMRLGLSRLAAGVSRGYVHEHRLPNTGHVVVELTDDGPVCVSWLGLRPG